jgi:hypothetical protein
MYQAITVPRANPVVTPAQLASFGRFDVPDPGMDYMLLQTFIEASTDQVEILAATACLTETIVETYDFWPDTQDPRNFLQYELSYAFNLTPYWWYGLPQRSSIELVRRPVIEPSASPIANQVIVTYTDPDNAVQTLSTDAYSVGYNKIQLLVASGYSWPLTNRNQDCIRVQYNAGYDDTDPTKVPASLRLAVMFLANHFWENRTIISTDPTSEVGLTLSKILQPFRSMRIPR